MNKKIEKQIHADKKYQNLSCCSTDENILSDLRYPMPRSKMNAKNIEDIENIENIIDRYMYQKHFAKGGFIRGTSKDAEKNKIYLSVQSNTDGVRLFKSSEIETWLVYFTIN